jgi:hypothetical protein
MYTVLTKTCNILHYLYQNVCALIVTYFIAESCIVTLVSAPWRWQDNNAETWRSNLKDSTNKI